MLFVQKTKLQAILKSKKYKPDKLAKELGVSRGYIYRILRENLPVGSKLIEWLLKEIGYKFEELFYFSDDFKSGSNLSSNRIEMSQDEKTTSVLSNSTSK